MAVNIEIIKQQVEFVKEELLGKKMRGDCSGIVVADYTKEEFEKIRPGENWEEYVEAQFLFVHYLRDAGILDDVQFQHIDQEGLQKFCREQKIEDEAAARGTYAALKAGKGGEK